MRSANVLFHSSVAFSQASFRLSPLQRGQNSTAFKRWHKHTFVCRSVVFTATASRMVPQFTYCFVCRFLKTCCLILESRQQFSAEGGKETLAAKKAVLSRGILCIARQKINPSEISSRKKQNKKKLQSPNRRHKWKKHRRGRTFCNSTGHCCPVRLEFFVAIGRVCRHAAEHIFILHSTYHRRSYGLFENVDKIKKQIKSEHGENTFR